MSKFWGLFDWSTGTKLKCFCCKDYIRKDDPENTVTVEYKTGKATYRICPGCADIFDKSSVGG